MKVLIRSRQSAQYFQHPGWTSDPAQAADFGHSGRALLVAVEEQLQDVEVVLFFDDPRYNITLPILDKTPHWPFDQLGR